MEIIYQDNRILVCIKPAGVLSTDEPGGLPGLLREELGEPQGCFRTVHRLDRVVSGVMVLARSRQAASILSQQVREGAVQKKYLALVRGTLPQQEGTFTDLLLRNKEEKKTYVVTEPGKDVQEAVLDYRVLSRQKNTTLVEITLRTGRTHQIRAQFSSRGYPLVGDRKYGDPDQQEGIALFSCFLSFLHPQTGERMTFSALPPAEGVWKEITEELAQLGGGRT
jgi:23S rRNA pseudouridine1911/1915/1917 synthase